MRTRFGVCLTLALIGLMMLVFDWGPRLFGMPFSGLGLACIVYAALLSIAGGKRAQDCRCPASEPWQANSQTIARSEQASEAALLTRPEWLPDVVAVGVALDLVADIRAGQPDLLAAIERLRSSHGITTKARITDDPLLASRCYYVTIGGMRVAGVALRTDDEFGTHLLATLEHVFADYAAAIDFFARQRAAAEFACA